MEIGTLKTCPTRFVHKLRVSEACVPAPKVGTVAEKHELLWTGFAKAGTTPTTFGAAEKFMSNRICWLCVLMIGLCLPGCGLMQSAKSVTRESMKSMKMRPSDYRNPTEEKEDEWTDVGRTASTVRGIEKDQDPLRKWMLSPKAMSIERNLGVE